MFLNYFITAVRSLYEMYDGEKNVQKLPRHGG